MSAPNDTMRRHLSRIAGGKAAQVGPGKSSITTAILDGIAIERGWARNVKHRDHTRSLALTPAGRIALTESEKS